MRLSCRLIAPCNARFQVDRPIFIDPRVISSVILTTRGSSVVATEVSEFSPSQLRAITSAVLRDFYRLSAQRLREAADNFQDVVAPRPWRKFNFSPSLWLYAICHLGGAKDLSLVKSLKIHFIGSAPRSLRK